MTPRRIALMVLIPVLAALGGFVHYGARGNYWLLGREHDLPMAEFSAITSSASVAGILAAAVLGALVGGAALVPLGLLMAAFGNAAVASGALIPGMILASTGRALVSVGVASAAGRLFPGRQESARIAFFLATYGAENLGAFGAPFAFGALGNTLGASWAVGAAAGLAGAIGLGAIALPALELTGPPEAPAVRTSWVNPVVLGAAGAAVVVGGLSLALHNLGSDLAWRHVSEDVYDSWLLTSLNPLVVLGCATVAGGGLAAAALAGIEVPGLALAGVGALLAAIGLGLGMVEGSVGYALGQVVGGLGEPLLWAGLYARVAGGVHWRLLPFGLGLLQLANWSVALISGLVPEPIEAAATVAISVALLVLGALLLAAAWPLKALLDTIWAEAEAQADALEDPLGLKPRPDPGIAPP